MAAPLRAYPTQAQAGSAPAALPAFQPLQLGGTFAYWHQRNAQQVERIQELEAALAEAMEERDSRGARLEEVTAQHQHAERCLKAEQCVSRELNERLDAALAAAAKDRAAAAEANARAEGAAAEAKAETDRISDLLAAREREMAAAQDEAALALEGKVGSEREASDLARRIADLLNQVDSLSKRSEALESQLGAMTRQRDHHQQHSDLMLKEKNRLIDANTALKRKVAEQAQQLAAEAAATAAAAAVSAVTPPPSKPNRAIASRSPISVLGVNASPATPSSKPEDVSPSPSPPPPQPIRRRTPKTRSSASVAVRPHSAGNAPQPSPAQVQAAREFAWQEAGAMEARRLGPTWIR